MSKTQVALLLNIVSIMIDNSNTLIIFLLTLLSASTISNSSLEFHITKIFYRTKNTTHNSSTHFDSIKFENQIVQTRNEHWQTAEYYEPLSSKMKSSEEIQAEIASITNGSMALSLKQVPLDKTLTLSMVVFHHENKDTALNLLSYHSLHTNNLREDIVTFYNHKIDTADEKNIKKSLPAARFIRAKNGVADISNSETEIYNFELKANDLVSPFEQRVPVSAPHMSKSDDLNANANIGLLNVFLHPNGQLIIQSQQTNPETNAVNTFYFIYVAQKITLSSNQ
jgi:hypothetical protein